MVVDDEPLAVEMLAGYVRRTPSLELISTFTDPVLAFEHGNTGISVLFGLFFSHF